MADNDIYEVDESEAPRPQEDMQPLYRIYEGSRIAISRHVGKMWKQKLDAAIKAYEEVAKAWNECFKYYNHYQLKAIETPYGIFQRGDCTENMIFSNLNTMLPAVYGKNPTINCTTVDKADEPFCDALEALINTLFKRRDKLNAKPKVKKATGMGLLTNFGIMKLDYTMKDDSREYAIAEVERVSAELENTEDIQEAEQLYGQLEALEMNLEVRKPSGPSLSNVLSQNLIIDPYAEDQDGLDGEWMIERIWMSTQMLTERFTQPDPNSEDDEGDRVLVYKPTHKAVFAPGDSGSRQDGMGMVLRAIDAGGTDVTMHTEDMRLAYLNMYFTECYAVWDKVTRRVMLFHRDDWKWPIWVWDDPLKLTRFFPYFIISYAMSTGSTVVPGETSYYLDQQDEVNDINRKLARIRRSVFDNIFYNSNAVKKDEIELFLDALRGKAKNDINAIGVDCPENMKIGDMVQVLGAPELQYEVLFNKQPAMDAINRLSQTSEALRGVQFKTNTNVAAVNTYQEAVRLSIGAKVDVVEDCVADLANALSELCVTHMDVEEVAGLIGEKLAEGWKQMSIAEYNATYNLELVAGSMEKPNSVFKKKEAIEIVQAVGQFARAAPGSSLRIMLRLLEKAFSDVVIKPEDWDALEQEIAATMQKGVSTEAGMAGGGDPGSASGTGVEAALRNLPDEVKVRVEQMRQQGAGDDQIATYLREQLARAQQGVPNGQRTQQRNRPQQQRGARNGRAEPRA